MTNTIDIKAKAPFPAGALSNFAAHRFELDDVICGSMEGFLQGLKVEGRVEQERTVGGRGAGTLPALRLEDERHALVAWNAD